MVLARLTESDLVPVLCLRYTKVSYHFCVLWTFVMVMGLRDSSE